MYKTLTLIASALIPLTSFNSFASDETVFLTCAMTYEEKNYSDGVLDRSENEFETGTSTITLTPKTGKMLFKDFRWRYTFTSCTKKETEYSCTLTEKRNKVRESMSLELNRLTLVAKAEYVRDDSGYIPNSRRVGTSTGQCEIAKPKI